jgi:GAF domain-containing protein
MQIERQTHASQARTRNAVLRSYQRIDSWRDDFFLDVVEEASRICSTPVALVSLLSLNRQWFKTDRHFGSRTVDLDASICARVVEYDGLFTVPDALVDPRVNTNAWVTGQPGVRFYAGFPLLTSEGLAVGTVCVLDDKPRRGLDVASANALAALARSVVAHLESQRMRSTGVRRMSPTVDIESSMFEPKRLP